MISTTRLYGAAIALVSGVYSLWGSTATAGMGWSNWLMLVLGAVVIVHGAVLLTAFADRLGDASGPLMVVWSVLMLLNQAWFGFVQPASMGGGMSGGMGTGMMDGSTAAMGWDPGMVALAVLMLFSGLVMTTRDGSM